MSSSDALYIADLFTENAHVKRYTLKSLAIEITTARVQFPTNKNLLSALIEYADELQAMMKAMDDKDLIGRSVTMKGVAHIQSKALQVAALAIRICEEGDESTPWGGRVKP